MSLRQRQLLSVVLAHSEFDISVSVPGVAFPELRERFGEEFFGLCFEENERVLRAVGGNLQDFFNGFDALLEHIRTSCGRRASAEAPSYLCKEVPPHQEGKAGAGGKEEQEEEKEERIKRKEREATRGGLAEGFRKIFSQGE